MKKAVLFVLALAAAFAMLAVNVYAQEYLRIYDVESTILRITREAEPADATWRVSVHCPDGQLIGGVGSIWRLDQDAEDDAPGFFISHEGGFTIIVGATAPGENGHEPVNQVYLTTVAARILYYLGGHTRQPQSYVTFVTNLAEVLAMQDGLVYFGRPTCPACVPFAANLHEIATRYSTTVYYLNTDNWRGHGTMPNILAHFGVEQVPSVAQVINGQPTLLMVQDTSWHTAFSGVAVEAEVPTMRLAIGSMAFTLHGQQYESDAAPWLDAEHDRTMIPLRIVSEGLGYPVRFDRDNRVVYIYMGDEYISLAIGVPLPGGMGTPVIIGNRTFVPARYVIEVLGARVRWDGANQAVYIYSS